MRVLTGNPFPSITSLNPSAIPAGSGTFQLTVNGNDSIFVALMLPRAQSCDGMEVIVKRAMAKPVLITTISAADVENPGQAQVTVFTPEPGGGTSNVDLHHNRAPPSAFNLSLNPTSRPGRKWGIQFEHHGHQLRARCHSEV